MNCLATSGYDSLEVTLGMETSERPGISIEKIERFEEKNQWRWSNFLRVSNASIKLLHPFVFLPGHRIMRLIRMYA